MGDVEAVGAADGLGIDLAAADDHDLGRRVHLGVGGGKLQPGAEARREDHALGRQTAMVADDDVGTAGKRLADGGEGLAPHDYRLAHGQAAEALHVGRQAPRQCAARADDAVAGNRGDERDADRHAAGSGDLRRRPRP